MTPRKVILALGFAAAATPCAQAGTITIANITATTAYQGLSPTPYFPGVNPYVAMAPIGADFQTSSLTVQTSVSNGGTVLSLSDLTRFPGEDSIAGIGVRYADIFLGVPGFVGTPDVIDAIALRAQAQRGGRAAGFYNVTAAETSQAIWGTRTVYIYGGAYGQSAAWQPGQPDYSAAAAPTVLTAGTHLGGAFITDIAMAGGWFDLDAQITLTPAEAAAFANGVDVFWGTGDCANGAFLAQLSDLPMPEPCSLAILLSGVFYLLVRRNVGAPSHRFSIKRVTRRAHGAHQIELGIAVD